MMKTPYDLLGGEAGIRDLAEAFYDAMDNLPEAESIRNMHKESLVDIKQKLFEYLSGWMGGPHLYFKKYQTICLSSQHKPYEIGAAEAEQWLMCMDQALVKIGASDEVKTMLAEPMKSLAYTIKNKD